MLSHRTSQAPSISHSLRVARRSGSPRNMRRILPLVALLSLCLLGAAKYKRSDWPLWRDADKDCIDTRGEVLLAQADGKVTMSASGCAVAAGEWVDPYSGETFHRAGDLDIDHVIPLEAAYQRGGWAWDREKRAAFANWEPGLLAVSASLNRSKGSKGPTEWLPPEMDACVYVRMWVGVAREWALLLTVEEAEMWMECQE